jgi:hypothetical protein
LYQVLLKAGSNLSKKKCINLIKQEVGTLKISNVQIKVNKELCATNKLTCTGIIAISGGYKS